MTQQEIKQALEDSVKEAYTAKTDDEIRQQAEGMYKQQFEDDLKSLRKQTEQNVLKVRRDSLDTGMQRSSYAAAQQGLVRNAGLESQQQLQSNYESNLANAIADLRDKDNERKDAADQYRNQLLLQLYNMGGTSGSSGSPGKTTNDPTEPEGDPENPTKNNYNWLLNTNLSKIDTPKFISQYLPTTKTGTTISASPISSLKTVPSLSVKYKNADGTTSTKYVNDNKTLKSIALTQIKSKK